MKISKISPTTMKMTLEIPKQVELLGWTGYWNQKIFFQALEIHENLEYECNLCSGFYISYHE